MGKRINILFAVYHDTNSNGRTQQVLHCAEIMGKSTLVSYRPVESWKVRSDTKVIVTGGGKRNYINFIMGVLRQIRKQKPDMIILHDNYCAILIPFIKKMKRCPYIVYDSSELYIDKTFRNDSKSYLIQRQENKYLHKADFVIAANIERAELMKKYFKLDVNPYVFENIRRIEDEVQYEECENKFSRYIKNNDFIIIYAGGVSKNRMTYDIIEAVKKLGKGYRLLLAGYKEEKENDLYEKSLVSGEIDNVFYLGYLKRSELKYLFSKVDLSVSMFRKNTLNNINCASGKLYESLFEGCPVLTSTNPPLKKLCDDYRIGVSTDDLASGISEIRANKEVYRENVRKHISTIDIEKNIELLSKNIFKEYQEYMG